VAAVSAVIVALAWVFAGGLIDLAFGSEYAAAEDWLGPLSAALALYGLGIVYLYHFLALGRTGISAVLVGLLAAQVIVYAVLADTPNELIGVQLAFGAATVVACEAWYLLRIR
jgi:hypothetical protein